jgi:hypothetical protein
MTFLEPSDLDTTLSTRFPPLLVLAARLVGPD